MKHSVIKKLSAIYNNQKIGDVVFDDNGSDIKISFEYDSAWIKSDNNFPLSPTIGFNGNYTCDQVKNFFRNILPEGENLDELSRELQVSKYDVFDLLKKIGIDLTAAFSLLDENNKYSDLKEGEDGISDFLIDRETLSNKLRDRNYKSFGSWNGKLRISMAGFQEKIGVKIVGNQMYLPDGIGNHSSHILKPAPQNKLLKSMISNEAYCMELSRKIGLDTANTEIFYTPEPVLLIERFDRKFIAQENVYEKLHQIDGVQLLDLPPRFRMERPFGNGGDVKDIRDGASLPKLAEAIKKHSSNPILDKYKFSNWIVFQLCIGNTDAHAKNISFSVNKNGKISIQPFYDQVSTIMYEDDKIDSTLSMAIDDTFNLYEVSALDLACMAYFCEIPLSVLKSSISDISSSIIGAIHENNFDTKDDFEIKDALFSKIEYLTKRLVDISGPGYNDLKGCYQLVQNENDFIP